MKDDRKHVKSMDFVRKLRNSFCQVLACAALIISQSNAVPSHEKQTHQTALYQVASDSKRDSILAEFYEMYFNVVTFEDRIAEYAAENGGRRPAQIEITKTTEEPFVQHLPSSALAMPLISALIQSEVPNSDLVVMGVPTSSRTLRIRDHTFLFTEYEVRISRVLSGDRHNILAGDTIIVSRGGGELSVDGVLVKAIEPAFDQFQLNQTYICFLHEVPLTDTYRVLGSGTFVVQDNTVRTASHLEAPSTPPQGLDAFLNEVSTAVERKRSAKR